MKFLALVALCLGGCAGASAQTITVGTLTLTHCIDEYDGYCGSLQRPLDPTGHVPGTISVGFEFYPHTGKRVGTVIAEEGGPGYSTTGSRDGYVRMLTPLRGGRDIVLVDKRGTGRSAPVDCVPLQRLYEPGLAPVRACGWQLGRAAWLYGSDLAADDVAAVLRALGTGQVDYYGDSYGTYFGQVFATRHADLLRTVVLDSAYPTLGEAPWFASEIRNGSVSLEKACARSAPCRELGGSTLARFQALLVSLRMRAVSGVAPGASGEPRRVTADAAGLFLVFANVGNNLTAYRDLDAAGRAYLEDGDAQPLLRLIAEARDGYSGGGGAAAFSTGLADAVMCNDYRRLYDMRAPESVRHRQFLDRVADERAHDPTLYAPFTVDEGVYAQMNAETLNICTVWPTAPAEADPGFPVPAGTVFPKLPVLVMNGELDTVTSPEEGRMTARLFPDARYVEMANSGHETAIGNGGTFVPPFGGDLSRCGAPIVRHFIESGGDAGDVSCAARVRPLRLVPRFVTRYADAYAPTALPGNQVGTDGLRLASAAAETVGDALARYAVTLSGGDSGLRGGRFYVRHTPVGYEIRMDGVKWTPDVAVSGVLDWDQLDGGIVARVTFAEAGHAGAETLVWNNRATEAKAVMRGQVDGRVLAAERVAP